MICKGLIRKKEILAVVAILLIVTGLPIACTQAAVTPTPTPEKIPLTAITAAVIAILFFFLLLIVLGYRADKSIDKGEMRRAIASMFAVGFVILVFLSLRYTILQEEVVTAFLGIASMAIGYYFGARTAVEKRAESIS